MKFDTELFGAISGVILLVCLFAWDGWEVERDFAFSNESDTLVRKEKRADVLIKIGFALLKKTHFNIYQFNAFCSLIINRTLRHVR